MTEITRVPILPIKKGSLPKLWIGVAAVLLAGAGLAYASVPHGVEVVELTAGTGESPGATDVIFARYVGKLPDGTVFDEGKDVQLPIDGVFPKGQPLPLAQMVPGFREGALKMKKGGKYRLEIPADKAYGANPPQGAPIPPNADLTFDIELVDFMSEEDFQSRLGMLQQMMQQAQGGQIQGGQPPLGAQPAPGQ
ncbi:putative peptidyl-prolyl cis-trans isomerase [Caenibius tardaugens NBRC 16725]|uniref:Peptidyl-prolyl cis-trans isomerase n=1 Tax=Caenibius tardaugens NBRC 16725 TaxID=1219035 RepID=U2YLX0_9SPHN|nr:FKBP-type peptidyl-prolyl cis-trans isomerase [Caenibius tardaugens]AZI36745.1 peptidylprolyl isomerase [Caenibius tardaugens NBRC 16725]GAD49417.1 putative peptidyl-prolyl cis-trans isomerase [Caenibius tardaugens NBRC 16725]